MDKKSTKCGKFKVHTDEGGGSLRKGGGNVPNVEKMNKESKCITG